MASHDDKMAALRKAEAGNALRPNEQHALNELAREHSPEGRRAQKVTGANTGDGKGILGI